MEGALITGGAGFIGSNLALELERRYPDIRVTIVDDFRSGEFSNLIGFRGDLVAQDLASLDLLGRFQPGEFRVVFHLASITDTTVTDARQMIWSNVEGRQRSRRSQPRPPAGSARPGRDARRRVPCGGLLQAEPFG